MKVRFLNHKITHYWYERVKHLDDCELVDYYEPCDLYIMYGVPSNYDSEINHIKKKILKYQKQFNLNTFILDISLMGQYDLSRTLRIKYFRAGFESWMNDGDFFDDDFSPKKFNDFCNQYNVSIKPYKKGKYINIILQKSSDPSMLNISNIDFLNNVINELKKYTDRPIKVRPHPFDDEKLKIYEYCKKNNIKYINPKEIKLQDDLKNCHATVMLTSTSCITSIIEGVPCFAIHPYNFAYELGNNNLKNIENPIYNDRIYWLYKIANYDWALENESVELYKKAKLFTYLRAKNYFL